MKTYQQEGFHAFSERDCSTMIGGQKLALESAVKSQNDNYILNVNREEYIEHLINEYSIVPLEIHGDDLTLDTHEEMIPAEYHSGAYLIDSDTAYPRDVVVFYLPFSGDQQLLRIKPSTYLMSTPQIYIEDGCICFKIINLNLTSENIKQQSKAIIESLKNMNNYLTDDLRGFNSSIERVAGDAFDARKKQLLEKNDIISALGVPIRKSDNTSSTFAIPAKRTKVIASKPKPTVTEKNYMPEPVLDSGIYTQILKLIHDVGKEFERLPSTYKDKEEEDLRDHMLLILEPNFEGSATGETFNKKGKTDILLRHEGSNVFIAELKFWNGEKGFLNTITQLLGYLTWRDSKAAVIMFVKNKSFSPVLGKAKSSISEHDNYLGFVKESEDGWYHYRFHINDDPNREVKLSVMLFHIPG